MRHFISAALLFMVCAAVAQTADFATTASSKKSELVPAIYYSDTISEVKIQILSESTKMIDLSPDALKFTLNKPPQKPVNQHHASFWPRLCPWHQG